jgi:TRAP transporter TAXI family solute receptor
MRIIRMWCAALSLMTPVLLSGTASAQTYGLATMAPGSFNHSTATAVAKVVADKAGLQIRVIPQGTVSLLPVDNGTADFGIENANDQYFFVTGTGDYEGRGPKKNLVLIGNLTPLRVGMFVEHDSPIKSIKDLKGKRVSGGFSAHKTIARLIAAHLANVGLSYDDVTQVLTSNIDTAADDFAAGKTDVLFHAFGAGKVKEINAKFGGLRALPIDPSPAAMKRVGMFLPRGYALEIKPSRGIDGVTKPIPIIAFDFVMETNRKLPEDTIYKITKALHDNGKELVATFPGLRLFDPNQMAKDYSPLVYHPGAIKFYKEIGRWPPKG